MIKTSVKYAIGFTLLLILVASFTYTISFPDEVMDFLISGGIVNVFRTISYFFPVKYALLCLGAIWLSKYSVIFIAFLARVYRTIMDFIK